MLPRPLRRAKEKFVVVLVAIGFMTALTVSPAEAVSADFGFDGCSWRMSDHSRLFDPGTWVDDLNGGCSRLRAYVKGKFEDGSRKGETTYIYRTCRKTYRSCKVNWSDVFSDPAFHVQARARAQSWETGRWQDSGWRW